MTKKITYIITEIVNMRHAQNAPDLSRAAFCPYDALTKPIYTFLISFAFFLIEFS